MRIGEGQGRDVVDPLSPQVERLPTGGEEGEPRGSAQPLSQLLDRSEDVLDIIQDEEHGALF